MEEAVVRTPTDGRQRTLRPGREWRAAATLAVLVTAAAPASAACPGPPAPEAAPPSNPARPAASFAEALLADLPEGTRLAVRPLDPRETALPATVARELYESVLNAVFCSRDAQRITVLSRERLSEVYATWEEFGRGDVPTLLQAAQANVEIICLPSPAAEGVFLSCSAVDLRDTTTVAYARALFPLARQALPFELAVARLASRLANESPVPGPVGRVLVIDGLTGARSDLGGFLGRHLQAEVRRRMAERSRREENEARARAVLATPSDAGGPAPTHRLDGILWRHDDERIEFQVSLGLRDRDGVSVSSDTAVIATNSLPRGLAAGLAAASSEPGSEGRMFEAVAEAVLSERLDRAAAIRAARNLARARVVAQALGLSSPGVREIVTEADAVAVFEGFLDRGLPIEERFSEARPEVAAGAEPRIAVRLAARVVPIGTLIRPDVSARLDRAVYRAMQSMRVEIRSRETLYLGVYAWGADNRVVRIYPRGPSPLLIGPGERLVLPRPGDGSLLSAPLPIPGNREDHEALVIVASPSLLDFDALAAAAGATLTGTIERSVDGSEFMARLAAQDPARMAVHWLPYQVHD